jgi:ubiquinone/menaquinone biosynthesis C-methylase UbiE
MKVRESGMPDQRLWESFFDPAVILSNLELTPACRDVVELGCGYGTFTTHAAQVVRGTVYALDIDGSILRQAKDRTATEGLGNVEFLQQDFLQYGTGLKDGSVDYVMLFNILHTEDPVALLREAHRNLSANGKAGIIHWNHDPKTPRGPPMAIRPRPADCEDWAKRAGFDCSARHDLPPYHYGFVLTRPS